MTTARFFAHLFLLGCTASAQTRVPVKLQVQLGHSDFVRSAAISPNGRYVLTGAQDGIARLWEEATGTEIRSFKGHSGGINSVVFSPDGRHVVTGSYDKTARLWDVRSGVEARRLEGHSGGINSVAFSPDGRHVVTGSDDRTARLWDVMSGVEIRRLEGHSDWVKSAAFSPDGRYVVTASYDTTARLWDATTGAEIRRLKGHFGLVYSVAFSPDGRYVVTGGSDKTARLWDVTSGAETRRFEGHSDQVPSVAFSPNGRYVVTGSGDKIALLWNVTTGVKIHNLEGHSDEVLSVAFSPDGRYVVTGNYDTPARLWDLRTGAEIRRFEGHSLAALSVAFSPDGRHVLTGSDDKTARLWDVTTGVEIRRLEGHSNLVLSVAFSPDGRYVVTGSADSTARLWDVTTGVEMHRLEGHSSWVKSASFSPDGRYVVTGSDDKTARLWDVTTGAEIRRFEGHSDEVQSASFSPDGRHVATGSKDSTVRLWDLTTGTEIRQLDGGSDWVTSVAFSPDGKQVVAGSDDKTARLWNVTTGVELSRMEGHIGMVTSVRFSPNGLWVLTGSTDGSVRLWEAATGRWCATMLSSRNSGWAVVDPEGRYDASDPDNLPGLFWLAEGDHVIQLGQLRHRFHEKGLLAKIFSGAPFEKKEPMKAVFVPPKASVLSVDAKTKTARIRLESVADGGYGPSILIRVNGEKVPSALELKTPLDPKAPFHEFTVDLRNAKWDPSGKDVVEVIAKDYSNMIDSRLGSGSRDVSNLEKAIGVMAKEPLFADVFVRTLRSGTVSPPTLDNVNREMKWISDRATPDDVVLVFFAGHGLGRQHPQKGHTYYFLTADAHSGTSSDLDSLEKASISSAQLADWFIKPTMPRKKAVILDTCMAGAAAPQLGAMLFSRQLSGEEQRAIAELERNAGAWALLGSSPSGEAYEASQFENGLLTYTLLTALRNPLGEDGTVRIDQWFEKAREGAAKLADSIGRRQAPEVIKARDTFPLGLLDGTSRDKIPVPRPAPTLLRVQAVLEGAGRDELRLGVELHERFIQGSRGTARGGAAQGGTLLFVYSSGYAGDEDDFPGAVKPYVDYRVEGDEIVARVRLRTRKQWWRDVTLRGSRQDGRFAGQVADWVLTQVQEWKP